MGSPKAPVLALSGGVGGAKLALGLQAELPAGRLHVLANTADDFEHLGLHICPDIDTLLYTLGGLADPAQGWGIGGDTFHALDALGRLGGETWFRLGDRDLATHLWRSRELAAGRDLQAVTTALADRLGTGCTIYPMSCDPVRTMVRCAQGELPFQHYFVREQCGPAVTGFRFEGIAEARPNPAVMGLLRDSPLGCVVICPSNPFVSIDPILQLPGLWEALRDHPAPVVLVSPIVAGKALKGPAAKMMAELGVPVTAEGVAGHYGSRYPGLVDHFVIDSADGKLAPAIARFGMEVTVTATVMKSLQDKRTLARAVLGLAGV